MTNMKLIMESWRKHLSEGVEDFYGEIGYSGPETLYDFEGGCKVRVILVTIPDGVEINLIEVVGEDCLRKGHATEIMERITDAADKYSIRIFLGATPLDKKIDREDLVSWYEKFGFETEHDDYETTEMVRFAKKQG